MRILPDDLDNKTGEPAQPVKLEPRRKTRSKPAGYKPDSGLVDAIKVALLIRKPLLLTGRPGTGKTELGHYLAWKMQLPVFQFDAKSTSLARDLFYTYDAIQHLRAGGKIQPYLRFQALGQAIQQCAIYTDQLNELLPDFITSEPKQSLVVIDEIDKTPRDFPNDLLNEIDQDYFHIPELENLKVQADPEKAPILVITSNSEKNLPAAFLRRCVYYNIPDHTPDQLREIVSGRITELVTPDGPLLGGLGTSDSPIVNSAVKLFAKLTNNDSGMRLRPGTAELLDWMLALIGLGATVETDLEKQPDLVGNSYQCLVKTQDDIDTAKKILGVK
jgi:MoxR-like ATPase